MKKFTPDPKKVEDIINMPTPQDKRGLQCLWAWLLPSQTTSPIFLRIHVQCDI